MSATGQESDRPAYNSVPGRIIHDADAHIMELPNWLRDHADPALRDRITPLRYPGGNELRQTGDPAEQRYCENFLEPMGTAGVDLVR